MKRIFIFLLILTWLCQTIFTQDLKPNRIKSIVLRDNRLFGLKLTDKNDGVFLNTHLGIPKDYEFKNRIAPGTKDQTREWDESGHVHERYAQYYKGIRVDHSDIRTHYFGGNLVTVNGEYIDVPDIDISVSITKNEAVRKAMAHIGAKKYIWEDEQECELLRVRKGDALMSFYPDPETVICLDIKNEDNCFRLAYKVDIRATEPFSHHYVYVDAKNGTILNKVSRIHHFGKPVYGTAAANPIMATAVTKHSGTRYIMTSIAQQHAGITTYRLSSQDYNKRWVHTIKMGPNSNVYQTTAYEITNTSTYWTVTNPSGALDAHWGIMMASDYFFEKFNYPEVSSNTFAWMVTAYFGTFPQGSGHDCEYDEEFGYIRLDPDSKLVSLDVLTHEYAHGFNKNTAAVGMGVYENLLEPASINEALCDIYAVCVQDYANKQFSDLNKDIWMIGDEISTYYRPRSLRNPKSTGFSDTYRGVNWEPNDSHADGCAMGHWFYILTNGKSGTNDNGYAYNVTGIGIDKAVKIVHKAQTSYMTSGTDFKGAKACTILAATALYGAGSNEVQAVIKAWDAVGIPFISGIDEVCYSGNIFNLSNYYPRGTLQWSVTGPFTTDNNIVGYPSKILVKKTGSSNSSGTLTASLNDTVVASINIRACQTEIYGDFYLCGESYFSTGNVPYEVPNDQFVWTCSPNLRLISGNTGRAKNIAPDGIGAGWVKVYIVPYNMYLEKNVFIPYFPDIEIYYPIYANCDDGYFRVDPLPQIQGMLPHYRWTTSGDPYVEASLMYTYGPENYYRFPRSGTGTIYAYGYDACGEESPWPTYRWVYEIHGNCSSYSSVSTYPNPASTILNIDFDQTALAQSQAFAQTTTDGKQLKQDKTFDIRLYDNQGTLLRHKKTKGGKVEFNVANLPNGIYYLHIYDGVNEKPEIRQIMVEH